ncbi:hypothetical protein ACTD5D_40420 [Nocardia takedensis]|uniref:hypothetical protein n=1 Tax=Nocardia takedensis TaxID=259390 RepID=UPI003F76247F
MTTAIPPSHDETDRHVDDEQSTLIELLRALDETITTAYYALINAQGKSEALVSADPQFTDGLARHAHHFLAEAERNVAAALALVTEGSRQRHLR